MRPPSTPCASCPWRRSSPPDGSGIPGFDLELMRGLAGTCGPDDAFRRVMVCHGTAEQPCLGYVAQEGWRNLHVRLLAMDGAVDIAAVQEACASLDLWPSFSEMLAAYEAAAAR